MGWDEVYRWNSGDRKISYYEELITQEDKLNVVRGVGVDRYPGLFDMSLALAHEATGFDRFYLGHIWSFLFGLTGIAAVWLTGRKLGGPELGFWAALFLTLTPPFYGHLFHNPKDIPFAAMYMVGLAGLVYLVDAFPFPKKRIVLLAGIVCGMAMAVRIAGMVLLCYLLAIFALLVLRWVWDRLDRSHPEDSGVLNTIRESLPRYSIIGFAVAATAFITLLPWWPAAHQNVLRVSGETLEHLHGSAAGIPLFFRGEIIDSADTPFYYALWMLAIKTPESLLLLIALAGVFAGKVLLRKRLQCFRTLPLGWTVIILGGFFPILYLSVTAPALHDGVRHFLFVYPPLAIIGAFAWCRSCEILAATRQSLQNGFRFFIYALLGFQILQLAWLHPYQYVYHNLLIGGPAGAYGRYHTEYWITANTHAIRWLDEHVVQSGEADVGNPARLLVTGPWHAVEPFLPPHMELTSDPDQADFFIATTEMMMHTLHEGEVIHSIERMGLPILVIKDLRAGR